MTLTWTEKITGCLQWKTRCLYEASVPFTAFELFHNSFKTGAVRKVLVQGCANDFFFFPVGNTVGLPHPLWNKPVVCLFVNSLQHFWFVYV